MDHRKDAALSKKKNYDDHEHVQLHNGDGTRLRTRVLYRDDKFITVQIDDTTTIITLAREDWIEVPINNDGTMPVMPISDLTLRWADVLHDSDSDEPEGETRVVTDFEHANLINSDVVDRFNSPVKAAQFANHKLVLDIDFPVKVVESSPGKSHLYIDKPITWDELISIMMTLVTAGIVERNYAMASIRRGYTSVRVPWALKGTHVPEPPEDKNIFDLDEL